MSMKELIEQAAKTGPAPVALGETVPEGETQICLFKETEIRKICHHDEWWYSVVDIVGILSRTTDPRRYWPDLKRKLIEESGSDQLLEGVEQLKMPGKDGKMYLTDCANAETIFRVVQSIPSPNAEPFKKWLARTAYERILEFQNPEIAIKRAIASYKLQGRDDEWIRSRLQTVVSRNELTSEWQDRGIQKGVEYALLTDAISMGTFGKTTKQHKEYKSLGKNHSLRDHMNGLELVLTMLGEEATKEIARKTDAQGFVPNKEAAKSGGAVAGQARKSIELQTRKPVVSRENFLPDKGSQKSLPEGE